MSFMYDASPTRLLHAMTGFTKANELFVGRVAMIGFAASLVRPSHAALDLHLLPQLISISAS